MSYTKGDTYLYRNGDYYVCHECKLTGFEVDGIWMNLSTPVFDTTLEAIDHLREHLKAGHDVPASAFVRLWGEIMRNKDKIVGK